MSIESDALDSLWVEKHRPKELAEVVLEKEHQDKIEEWLKKGAIPHLLMVGPAGSGKTTTARIICNYIIKDDADILELNGSDQTGVDTVRDSIKGFLKSPPHLSAHKIVFIDEFDYMSQNAQGALRNIFETYAGTGRFVCTGNYKSKIIDALLSRFQIFEMKTVSQEFAIKYCQSILDFEKIEYDIDTVSVIVESLIPDVRKIVGTLQQTVIDGKLHKIDKNSIATAEKKLVGLICMMLDSIGTIGCKEIVNSSIVEVHELLNQGEVDYLSIYDLLFHNKKIPVWAKIVVNRYSNMHYQCLFPNMHFVAMVYECIQNGKKYHETFE